MVIQWLEGLTLHRAQTTAAEKSESRSNNWVNGREDVKGKISITAKLELSQITIDSNNTLVVTVGSQVYPVTIRVDGPGILPPGGSR